MSSPTVSVIVPCFNEESTIRLLLDAIGNQTFPQDQIEVILADGMSTDGTRAKIERYRIECPGLDVRIVDNLKRAIPSGLNRAIEAACGEYIVRLDAHSVPAPDYLQNCVAALQAQLADNVGGVWEIRAGGKGWTARSIAAAAAHPFGVGDALYRFTTRAAFVDTVPFGSFRRATLQRIGLFDENLLTNEDYELNVRLRQAGGKVWLDPRIRSAYFARSSLDALARQYFRYGYWKLKMLRRYPGTLRWRQALPPVFVLSLLILLALSLVWTPARFLLLFAVMVYLLVLWMGALPAAVQKKDLSLMVGVPLAIATMHLSWGGGFLFSLVRK